ncbi:MAG: IclR family transcriptional regulator [Anaerolineae bacterium]|nr:IclR family transcriptional regulator [Anaerolineae bacterium]
MFLSIKPPDVDGRYFIGTIHRGLRILEAFSEARPSLSLVEIAAAVDLDKSTAFRFVYTLQELGYLERDPETKRYRPGLKVLRLGFTVLNGLDSAQIARPYLKSLSAQTGTAANMALRDGTEIVYIQRVSPLQILNVNLHVGSRLPVHCSSMGKAQLLDFSCDELDALLGSGPYQAYTPHTIIRRDALCADLARARERGYAVSDEEMLVGIRSIAAPIRDTAGEIVAAINVSAASAGLSRPEMEARYAREVVDTAARISRELGAAPETPPIRRQRREESEEE